MTNEKPHESFAGQAAYLLQRYFDDEITEQEGSMLLDLWERFPELMVDALKNYEADHLMRFLTRLESERRKLYVHTSLPASSSLFFASGARNRNEGQNDVPNLDFDSLIRLADQSEPLIRKPVELPNPVNQPAPSAYRPVSRNESRRIWMLVLIVLLFFIPFVYQELRDPPDTSFSGKSSSSFVATIINDVDVKWNDEKNVSPMLGVPLDSRRLHFDSGTMELLFYDGVRCIVEGPADLVLVDRNHFFARRGRFSVDVPEQGRGFEIQTPGILIRDLGTQFFASVDGERSELHVVKGLVETEKSGGEKNTFKTDQAGGFLGNELIERMDAVLDRFVTKSEMKRRSDSFYRKWLDGLARQPEKNPFKGPVCEVDFTRDPIKDAMFYGGEFVEGRPADGRAFRLVEKTDRMRLKSGGTVDAMTALIWVRIDRLNYEMNPILMTEGNRQGGLVCHVLSDGKLLVGIRYRSGRSSGIFETPVVFTEEMLGKWVRVGFSIGGPGQQIVAYVDDDPVLSRKLTQPGKISLRSIDIGSWKLENRTKSRGQQLDGAIGKIVVYDRVLSSAEIKSLP